MSAQATRAVVSPMLLRLARERATGAMVRDHGTLYLVDGRVAHAESPVAPGPDVLLTAGGRRPRHDRIPAGELEICHLGALFDAAFFALAPGRGPARFQYGVAHDSHAVGPIRPVSAASVERETLRRRELLDSVWPYPSVDTAPVVPRTAAPGQTVTARQRALLAHADGARTPAQLAWALGRPAFHTLLEIRRLAAAGLVDTPHEPAPHASFPLAPPPHDTAPDDTAPHALPGHETAPPHAVPGHEAAPHPAAPHEAAPHPAAPHEAAPSHAATHRLPTREPHLYEPHPREPRPREPAPYTLELAPYDPAHFPSDPDIALLRRLRDALEAHL
ncbi:hypothetical protein ACGF5F_22175 [Streptomyces sp. NPDC047821]|uniref:hypothetical protein n=1 Tax=Streptomyces sp. NPDC047821 TaxID=3365488 RepID=UPI0037224B7C